MPVPELTRSRFVAALAAILLIAGAVRFHRLGGESLWLDEAFAVSISRGSLSHIVAETSTDVHPPLYYFALHYWMPFSGDSEAGARSLSVLFSLATILAAAGFALRLFDRRTALFAAILLAIAPFQVEFAQEARMYALLALLGALSTWAFAGLIDAPGLKRWPWAWSAAYVAATSVMAYTHIYGMFVIAAHALTLGLLLVMRRAKYMRATVRWIAAQIAVVLLFSPWISVLRGQTARVQQGFWIAQRPWIALLEPLLTYGGSFLLAVILFALVLVAMARMRDGRRGDDAEAAPVAILWPWFLCPIALPFLLSRVGSPIFLPKYTIAASVPFAILAGRGLTGLNNARARALVLGVIVVLSSWTLRDYFRTPHKNDWRTIAGHVERVAHPGDLLLFYRSFNYWAYDYYRRRPDIVEQPLPLYVEQPTPEALDAVVQQAVGDHRRVWLVTLESEPLKAPIVDDFERSFTATDHLVSVGVETFLFVK